MISLDMPADLLREAIESGPALIAQALADFQKAHGENADPANFFADPLAFKYFLAQDNLRTQKVEAGDRLKISGTLRRKPANWRPPSW